MAQFMEGQYGVSVAIQGKSAQSSEADEKLRQIMAAVSDADLIKTLKARGYKVSRGVFAKCVVSAIIGAAIAFAIMTALAPAAPGV